MNYQEEEEEETGIDYNSLSDLQSEWSSLNRWANQYNSKGANAKLKQLEDRINYLKSINK